MKMTITAKNLIDSGRSPGSILMDTYRAHAKPDTTLPWLNLGYWFNESTYQGACQNLAKTLGEFANLNHCSNIVDAGSGLCAPAIFWAQTHKNLNISSLNIFSDQVAAAQEWINKFSLSKRITQRLESATNMPHSDRSIDAVIALESAFHFDSRVAFINEARRVLRPGGVLALADMVPFRKVSEDETGNQNLDAYRITRGNLITLDEYRRMLEDSGFEVKRSESIRSFVYPYFYEFISRLSYGGSIADSVSIRRTNDQVAYDLWRQLYCIDDFILVQAIRKSE